MGRKGTRILEWLRINGLALFLFELLYQTAFFILIVPLAGFAFRTAIRFSPYSYVTLQNLAAFLRRPLTILILIGFLAVTSVFIFAEGVSLIVFFETCIRKRKVRVTQLLLPGLIETARLLKKPGNLLLLPVTLLFSVIFILPYTLNYLMQARIPGYLIRSAVKEPAAAAAIFAGLLILLYLALRSMFAVHFSIHESGGARSGIRRSGQLFHGNAGTVIRNMVLVNLFFLCSYVLFYVLCVLVCGLFIFWFVDKSLIVATFLSLMDQIELYTGFAGMLIGITANFAMATRLFCQLVPPEDFTEGKFLSMQKEIEATEMEAKEKKPERKGKGRYLPKGRYQWFMAVLALVLITSNLAHLIVLLRNGSILDQETLAGIGITSHRGASYEAPENTIPALEKAIESRSDYAEIDVQLTKDGEVVLLHDANLKRTTGFKKNIWDTTYEEIKELDAGRWFSKEFEGTGIPTFEEALKVCKGKINLNIEIKTNKQDNGLTNKVLDLIEQYDFENQCIISSADYNALVAIKTRSPNLKTGYIMGLAYGYFYDREYADFFSIKSSFITESVVQIAHSLGKEIHAWTVNTEGEMERMKQLEVDNIITDRPVKAREVLNRGEFRDNFTRLLKLISEAQ